MKFGLFGRIVAHSGKRDQLVQSLMQAAELMEQAEGCDLYAVGTAVGDGDGVWVTEIWHSEADHDASLMIDGVQELIASARPFINEMGESHRIQVVGGKGLPHEHPQRE